MSGSIPEPEVVTASTGMSPMVRPGVVRPLELQDRGDALPDALARSGFVGPRFANVVAPALYAGEVAEGRSWKYCGFVNDWAASSEPTTWPFP